ncbi:hypothetical protein ACLOJK_024150, partial [Asimina triloba]
MYWTVMAAEFGAGFSFRSVVVERVFWVRRVLGSEVVGERKRVVAAKRDVDKGGWVTRKDGYALRSSVGETPGVSEDIGCMSRVGSTGSGGEVSIIAGRIGAAIISESVSMVPVTHNLGSFSHINFPFLTVSDLLFNGGGVDDLNVNNVDRPLRLPSAHTPILSGSFFDLVPPERAERSPSSVHRAGSSGEGGMSETEGPKGSCAVTPVEGGAVMAIVLDSDERSGDNSSMGQHIPTGDDHHVSVGGGSPRRKGFGGSYSGPAPPLDINVEFVEPFWQL